MIRKTIVQDGHYAPPHHGWTCFHCGDTFFAAHLAREHFGADPLSLPGCRIKTDMEHGLLSALRDAEAQLARYREEDSDSDRRMAVMVSEHGRALKDAEEAGYQKGMKDGLALIEAIEGEGLAAGQRGAEAADCPYDDGTRQADAWLTGWSKS